jgi:hypothetical protein
MLVCAVVITSCDSGTGSADKADSAIKTVDSVIKANADTLQKAADTVIRKMDSAGKAILGKANTKIRAAADIIKKSLN